ncbi:tetratricopeptide repeat protein [Clostridioides difficile]
MESKKNDFFNENKESRKKNKYVEPILTIGLSLLFTFGILAFIQSIMGEKTITITNNKAEEYYYDGKFDEAINEYMLMQNDDKWPVWTAKAAEVYSIKGEIAKSDNLLKEAIVKRDKVMLEEGDKYLEQDKDLINKVVFTFYMNGDLEQAESLGEYYLTTYSTYKPLLKTMFAISLATDNKELSKEIVDTYPVDLENAYDLAILAKMQILLGNYEDGLNNLKKSYELDKNEMKSFDVIMETCEFDKEKLLENVSKLSEENPSEEVYKIWLEEIKSTNESIMNLSDNIMNEINSNVNNDEVDKDSYVYAYIKAWNYYNKGQYDKALDYCKEAIMLNPQYSNSFGVLMPKLLIATENSQKVDGYFRTAIYNEPFNSTLITNIAEIYKYDLSNYDKAKELFNLALSLNSKEDELYYYLAFVDLAREKEDEAIEDLNNAISMNEDNYKYYRALGTIYYNIGENDKAIENIRKAYSLNEKDVLSLNNAACYYVMVDKDIWRGYTNIESAYNDMPSDLDKESKELITKNYEAIKKVYDKYVNDENTVVDLQTLELAY